MRIAFVLEDATPMTRRIAQVVVGSRPALNESYLKNTVGARGPTQAYRHIVAHTLLARALHKALRGLTPSEVREWLSRDEAWLDPVTLDTYRAPVLLNGEIPDSLLGVQSAVGAWLANATNYTANLAVGVSDINTHKGAKINPGFAAVKKGWSRELCPIEDVVSLHCYDIQRPGEEVRYEAGGMFYGGERPGFLDEYLKRPHFYQGTTLRSTPGTKLVIQYYMTHTAPELRYEGSGLLSVRQTSTDAWSPVGMADPKTTQIHSSTGDSLGIPSSPGDYDALALNLGCFSIQLLVTESVRALRVSNGAVLEVSRSLEDLLSSARVNQDRAELLLKAAIDPPSLHDKVVTENFIIKRSTSLKKELVNLPAKIRDKNRAITSTEKDLEGATVPKSQQTIRNRLRNQKKALETLGLKQDELKERQDELARIQAIKAQDLDEIYTAILKPELTMEDPRTGVAVTGGRVYERRPIAVLALGWKNKYLPREVRDELDRELTSLENQERHHLRSTPQVPLTTPSTTTTTTAPAPRDNDFKIWPVGFVLEYDSSPMTRRILKVITGERPALQKGKHGLKKVEGEDLRHIVPYVLIAKALRQSLKGLTLEQVAQWVENPQVWFGDQAEQQLKQLRDNVGLGGASAYGKLMRTVGAIQSAVGAWLDAATNDSSNLYSGDRAINVSKGASIHSRALAIKQVWRRYLCKWSDVERITCQDQLSSDAVDFRRLEPIHEGTLRGKVSTAVSRDLQLTSCSKGVPFGPKSHTLALGGVLTSYPGTCFRVTLQNGEAVPIQPGALLIDKTGHVFQVSRQFSLIEKRFEKHSVRVLSFPAKDSSEVDSEHQDRSKAWMVVAVDPLKLQAKKIEDIDATENLETLLAAMKSMKMKCPAPNSEEGWVSKTVVEVALGETGKYMVPTDFQKIQAPPPRQAQSRSSVFSNNNRSRPFNRPSDSGNRATSSYTQQHDSRFSSSHTSSTHEQKGKRDPSMRSESPESKNEKRRRLMPSEPPPQDTSMDNSDSNLLDVLAILDSLSPEMRRELQQLAAPPQQSFHAPMIQTTYVPQDAYLPYTPLQQYNQQQYNQQQYNQQQYNQQQYNQQQYNQQQYNQQQYNQQQYNQQQYNQQQYNQQQYNQQQYNQPPYRPSNPHQGHPPGSNNWNRRK
ncbi:hypothetical protein [Corallococcus exiguus]|uniref:hypothetical protein n=1 Tax=Corallococcus exiguus TaxID=83462 RepID=UPI00155FDEC2|nr:hypothetical protein [Corallococcus exiguus]NRD45259.1 hypothetical protein [Corallococcus exiguus]